jgi:sporulation protein YlmC with PRC-barrel domain
MKTIKIISILFLVGSLTACGTAVAENTANETGKVEKSVNGSEGSSTNTSHVTEVIKEEAAYVGQIDSNSIEINTETETLALQTGEIKNVDWASITKNSSVVIEYYKNENGQHILKSISVKEEKKVEEKKPEEKKAEVIREEAAYVGQIDANSIEVNTEFKTLALQIGEVKGVEWNSIPKNAKVIIEYYKNENGQSVLTKIEIK